ncbi:hypothetical protein SAMN04489724_2602 [Algoriphagus locisalis]|uniref:Uncharacterized protein n=1 Tax=Algoriphagus locisalis TaxID=305507 RepID=A0A1I7BQ04_9BACT|nr:hypothetical protein [Algoriphagus locisalis]SFT89229.1 hypothetical protein SAMN04489724_2602 [Algoriphagus locisalis]|tara:strand:- start:46865 stop:47218 length:354 start_codon:yes stop_codon:yes gene_type:complete
MISASKHIEKSRIALGRVIAPLAFWSYPNLESVGKIPDELLIEAVLIHGNDALRRRLFSLYEPSQIKNVWKSKLIIQGPRLDFLNIKLAKDFFSIAQPEKYIEKSYQRDNLYERFST